MSKPQAYPFRPHHLLCALGFVGKGYSPSFVRNFKALTARLSDEEGKTVIQIVAGPDHICGPCPNLKETLCEAEEKIRSLDKAHASVLEIQEGDRFTWEEAKKRVAQKMTLEKFHHSCAPCSWKSLGVCEKALRDLRGM